VIYAAGNDPLPTWYIRKGKYIYIYEEKIGTAHKTQWGRRRKESGKWKMEKRGALESFRSPRPPPGDQEDPTHSLLHGGNAVHPEPEVAVSKRLRSRQPALRNLVVN